MEKEKIKDIAKMMEMPKINNEFIIEFIESIKDFRVNDSLPFGTSDYVYMDEIIEYLKTNKGLTQEK